LSILVEPTELIYSNLAEPTKTWPKIIYSIFTEDKKEEFRHLQQRFKRDWDIYIKKDTAIAAVQTWIQETVLYPNLGYIFNYNTIYNILVKLKERLSSTNTTRTRKVLLQYCRILQNLQNQEIDI
jgi:hypothetical protein